jgi:hypothetical protein
MIHLPRLRRDVKIIENGLPTLTFHQWMNEFISKLEDNLNTINDNIASIQATQNALEAGIKEAARLTSYTNPTVVLTAADVGTTATITIANHTRVYPVNGPSDISDVTITGGTVTGAAFSTTYYVYYDDETLVNGTPTYYATPTPLNGQVGTANGRHFVGKITTPADGAGPTTGTGATPIGNGSILP